MNPCSLAFLFKAGLVVLIVSQLFVLYVKQSTNQNDFLDFVERSSALGYHVEEHLVETADGFILGVHRINGKIGNTAQGRRPMKPILMGHGLGGSSDTFIRNIEERSLAYVLAKQGHDVFIMNSRGNFYSQKHKNLSRESDEYWNFSYEDMAKYDLPAVAAYIFNFYNQQTAIDYIGHSQGCTIILAALADGTVPASYFEDILLITPAAIQQEVDSVVQNIIKNTDVLELLQKMGMKSFFQLNKLNYYACRFIPTICEISLAMVTDTQNSPIDHDIFYKLMLHYPSGTSMKAYIHFAQNIRSKKFQHFDYGSISNLMHYNQTTAPEYNLTNIHNKIHIIAGSEDKATPLSDIYTLKNALVNARSVSLEIYEEGHCSFILGTNNKYQEDILSILSLSSSSPISPSL